MSRLACYDWSALTGHDPIPGDPDAVLAAASTFAATATALADSASNLRRLDSPDTCSDAVAKILTHAHDLAGKLESAKTRYDAVSGALKIYGPVLQHCQDEAVAALHAATPALQRQREANRAATQAWWQAAQSLAEPTQYDQHMEQYHRDRALAESAAADLASAKARLQRAIDERDRAADSAASRIEDAIHGSNLNDSAWDRFCEVAAPVVDALVKIGKWIWDNIETISLVLDIASLALGWVPILGQVLIVAAKVARVVALVKQVVQGYQAIATAVTTGDWAPVVGMGATMLLTWGAGKAFGKLGSWASGKASKLTDQTVKGYNSWLTRSTNKAITHAEQTMAYGNSVGMKTIQNRIAAKAVPNRLDYTSLHLGTGHNPVIRNQIHRIDAIVGVAKGSDYQFIKGDVDTLARLSHLPTVSNEVRAKLAHLAATGAEKGIDKLHDTVVDAAQDQIDHWVETHRSTRQECVVR